LEHGCLCLGSFFFVHNGFPISSPTNSLPVVLFLIPAKICASSVFWKDSSNMVDLLMSSIIFYSRRSEGSNQAEPLQATERRRLEVQEISKGSRTLHEAKSVFQVYHGSTSQPGLYATRELWLILAHFQTC
ncbi:hypothetical protein GQ43DRAFT_492416, partial [Delitschia confertaspora ATCC 74209]